MIKEYRFCGYQNYEGCRQEIKQMVNHATQDEDMRFYLAINEAVCNAAKYSMASASTAEIFIRIRIDQCAIQAHISCQTKKFDIRKYREKLRVWARDEKIKNMDWGDFTHDDISGRGFWYMLSACDYIFMEETGQHIILHNSLPISLEHKNRTHIRQLVPRLFIDDRGLII